MASRSTPASFDWQRGVLEVFPVNGSVKQHLLEHLHPDIWRTPAPGYRGKCVATTFAHMHNCRLMWLKMANPSIARPPARAMAGMWDRAKLSRKIDIAS